MYIIFDCDGYLLFYLTINIIFPAVGMILFETRMGCLSPSIPSRVQEFIDAIDSMMASSLAIIVGEELHRKYDTRFWRRHKDAWDKIFEIGKWYFSLLYIPNLGNLFYIAIIKQVTN